MEHGRRGSGSGGVPPHRRPVLLTLLGLTIVCGLVFAPLNYAAGHVGLASVEAAMVALAATLMALAYRSARLAPWILGFLLILFSCLLYAFMTPITGPSVFVWAMLIPLLSHLLLGRWLGLSVSAVFLVAAGAIFDWRYSANPDMFDPLAVADILLCTLCVFGFSHVYEISRERTESRLQHMAFFDPLTGLANRVRFRDVFERERLRYRRTNAPVCILIVDLDYFKQINDSHGHDAGDVALCFVAEVMNARLRGLDLAGRIGGEEFGIILADTRAPQALVVAEDLRRALEARPFSYHGHEIALSMTVGVAELGVDGEDFTALFSVADQRLYEGKAEGRNCVVGPAVLSESV